MIIVNAEFYKTKLMYIYINIIEHKEVLKHLCLLKNNMNK